MSFGLLFPAALAGLAALLIPLVLHLARRNQLRLVDFSALRWLRAKPRPRQRLRFDNIPLLLLRLVLLALLVLWLAQPVLRGWYATSTYVAVMQGVTSEQIASQALPERSRLHWLLPTFPSIETPASTASVPVASLLRQLDAELPVDVPVIVLATAVFDGSDAQRPQLSRAVQWRVVDEVSSVAENQQRSLQAPVLHLVAAPSQQAEARILQAVAQAWHPSASGVVRIDENAALAAATWPDATQTVVVWLSQAAMPATLLDWVKHGGTVLLSASAPSPAADALLPQWQADDGRVLLTAGRWGVGQVYRFAQPLTAETMPEVLEASFPDTLQAHLQPQTQQPQRAFAMHYQPQRAEPGYVQAAMDIRPWLALLIALLFALERWLATRNPVEAAI